MTGEEATIHQLGEIRDSIDRLTEAVINLTEVQLKSAIGAGLVVPKVKK